MIFCVEDDSSIRDLMIYTLSSAGFEAEGFADGEALFDALKTMIPQLIMLDIMLPGEDGITILKNSVHRSVQLRSLLLWQQPKVPNMTRSSASILGLTTTSQSPSA